MTYQDILQIINTVASVGILSALIAFALKGRKTLSESAQQLKNTIIYEYRSPDSHVVLAMPITVVDWDVTEGKEVRFNATGERDIEAKKRFDTLLADGYEIISFAIDSNKAYFLFRKIRLEKTHEI